MRLAVTNIMRVAGKTVFVGTLSDFEGASIKPADCKLLVGDQEFARLRIEGEVIHSFTAPPSTQAERAQREQRDLWTNSEIEHVPEARISSGDVTLVSV